MNNVIELDLPISEIATSDMVPGPLSMAMHAIKAGMSVADMRSMLDLQKDWEANEARKAYALAMSAFKAEPVGIFKTKAVGYIANDGSFVTYNHAELSDVTTAISPAMSRHQLSHRWDVAQENGFVTVKCLITHAMGHSESISMTASPDDSGGKNAIQQIASTVSYLQRYTLLAITGMAAKGIDDDAQGAYAPQDLANVKTAKAKAVPLAAPATYPQAKFDANLPAWTALVQSGRKTAEAIIKNVSLVAVMTETQKATILAIVAHSV
jgi:hypothetical protein